MTKIIVSVAVAIVLGVVFMLMPIMVYTRSFASTEVITQWYAKENKLGLQAGENATASELTSRLDTVENATQTYGIMNAGPSPFPLSLFHTLLMATTGLVAAIGVSVFFKRKMKLL